MLTALLLHLQLKLQYLWVFIISVTEVVGIGFPPLLDLEFGWGCGSSMRKVILTGMAHGFKHRPYLKDSNMNKTQPTRPGRKLFNLA